MRPGLRALLLSVPLAIGGCGGSSVLEESELVVQGGGWYRLHVLLLTPSTGCLAQRSTTSYALDGVALDPSAVCGASSADRLPERQFTVGVRNGSARGQMVVADMFPGLQAAVLDPPDGRVPPGGVITVGVPLAAQTDAVPERAFFEYLDADDPAYVGEQIQIANSGGASPSTEIQVRVPMHRGHFRVLIERSGGSLPRPALSCVGVGTCTARAAVDLGPVAIDVQGAAAGAGAGPMP